MAGALVLITIPTAAEEARLKAESLAKTGKQSTGRGDTEINIDTESDNSVRDIFDTRQPEENPKKKCRDANLPIPKESCMELVVREILKKFKVATAVWSICSEGRLRHVNFNMNMDEAYEHLLLHLQVWGIGKRPTSSVSIASCVQWPSKAKKKSEETEEKVGAEPPAAKAGIWERFLRSVQTRANVGKVVRKVRQDAALTFDFLVLLLCAAVLSCFGLEEDSIILLTSSMLISPLMGPIIAGIFGTAIHDRSLRMLGLRNEAIGLSIATVIGLGFGFLKCLTDDRYGTGEGITAEMLARCDLHSLLIGTIAAIPSGAAVAIGILAGNISSLVGVAISASLLPPAINAGILWALAVIYKFYEQDEARFTHVVNSSRYSKNQAVELVVLGVISLSLTLFNILFVYLVGLLTVKVKEVAPGISANERDFWQHDIQIARNLSPMADDADEAVIHEFTHLPEEDQHTLVQECGLLDQVLADKEKHQSTWSSLDTRYIRERLYPTLCRQYNTIHQFRNRTTDKTLIDFIRRPTVQVNNEATTFQLMREGNLCPDTQPTNETSSSTSTLSSNISTNTVQFRPHRFTVTPAEDPLATRSNECDV